MECKAASKLPRAFLRLRFNRNIVECKATKRIDPVDATLVLIETLWNVKIGAIAAADKPDMVLIETLWNVK